MKQLLIALASIQLAQAQQEPPKQLARLSDVCLKTMYDPVTPIIAYCAYNVCLLPYPYVCAFDSGTSKKDSPCYPSFKILSILQMALSNKEKKE